MNNEGRKGRREGGREGRRDEGVCGIVSLTGCVSHTLRCPTINHALI